MQTQQLEQMNLSETQSIQQTTIEDILGIDINSQLFQKMMVKQIYSDNNNISCGNQNITTNSFGFTIKPQIQNAVLVMDSLCIVTRLTFASLNQYIINAVALFQPLSCKIGKIMKSYQFADVYNQMSLNWMSESQLHPLRQQIMYSKVDENDLLFLKDDTGNGLQQLTQLSANDSSILTNNPQYLETLYNMLAQKQLYCNSEGNICVPLKVLYPDLFNDLSNYMYIKQSGDLQFTLQTVNASKCSFIKNTYAAGAYTPLIPTTQITLNDMKSLPQISNALMSSKLEFQTSDIISQPIQLQQVTTCTLGLPTNNIKAFSFAVCSLSNKRNASLVNSQQTYYGAATGHQYFSELMFKPLFKIKQITFNLGTQQHTLLNLEHAYMHQIVTKELCNRSPIYTDILPLQNSLFYKSNYAYYFDLSRFSGFDQYTSVAGQQITINITFDFTEDLSPYAIKNQQTAIDATSQANFSQNYQVYFFAQTLKKGYMVNGQYQD